MNQYPEIRIEDYSKPLNAVQKALVEGYHPIGEKYAFNITAARGSSLHDSLLKSCPPSWREKIDETLVSENGKNFIRFNGSVGDRTENLTAILTREQAEHIFSNIESDKNLSISGNIHKIGEVYEMSTCEYAFSLHEHADILHDWMVTQVEKNSSISRERLAMMFREKCAVPKTNSPSGISMYDFEAVWARKELDLLVKEGVLDVGFQRDGEHQQEYLRVHRDLAKESAWKDVSKECGKSFAIRKELEKSSLQISMDEKNHVFLEEQSYLPNKKAKVIYKGKKLSDALRAAEDYEKKRSFSK